MQLITTCQQCVNNQSPEPSLAIGEYSNDHFNLLTCLSGKHKIKYFSALPDYPIFFNNGVRAFVEKEYFEAFTSIYHSYEMFKFTFVELVLLEKFNLNYEQLLSLLKPIRKSSVQIDGAFNTLYAAFFEEVAIDIPNNMKKLRNDIIHGTHYPNRKDILKSITDIYSFIKKIELNLPNQPTFPTTLFQKLGDKRLNYLETIGILKKEDFEQGLASIMTDHTNCLGQTMDSGKENYHTVLTTEQIIDSVELKMSLFKHLNRISNQSQ